MSGVELQSSLALANFSKEERSTSRSKKSCIFCKTSNRSHFQSGFCAGPLQSARGSEIVKIPGGRTNADSSWVSRLLQTKKYCSETACTMENKLYRMRDPEKTICDSCGKAGHKKK